jgi:hypothetical protein
METENEILTILIIFGLIWVAEHAPIPLNWIAYGLCTLLGVAVLGSIAMSIVGLVVWAVRGLSSLW